MPQQVDIRSLAARAGFKGRALDTIVAIVMAESGGNPKAYNGNRDTGDSSYGLAQINMLGGMGPERRKQYGLSSNDDLFDPLTNLKVAYALSGGGKNFSPWTTYKNGLHEKYLGKSPKISSPEGEGPAGLPVPGGAVGQLGASFAPPSAEEQLAAPGGPTTADGGIYGQVMAGDDDGFIDPFDTPDSFEPEPVMSEEDFKSLYSGNLTGNAEVYDQVQSAPVQVNNPRQADRVSDVGGAAGKVARLAQQFVGTPYAWGGTSPDGFDCSGLLQYVFAKVGVNLPRVSYQQARAGQQVSAKQAQAGDIYWVDNSTRNNGADHVALYLGGGQILEAARPGTNVRVRRLGDNEGGNFTRVL